MSYTGAYSLDLIDADEVEAVPPRRGSQQAPCLTPPPEGVAPPAAPPPAARLLYVRSLALARLSQRAPVNQDRPLLVHSLIEACGLLEDADLLDPAPASIEALREFHSPAYLAVLQRASELSEQQLGCLSERQLVVLAAYGLQDDCPPYPGVFEHAALAAGGSLAAARALASGTHRLAVHLDGGRHHAHKDSAAGFCYLSDVVLAILCLRSAFRRVLYVDIDIHHGDGVEEAFRLSDRVCTLSLHKRAPGFFPSGGALGDAGAGAGAGFALNLPLGDGLRDGLFCEAFERAAGGAAAAYRPDCVVLQCGVDGLAHDPVAGSWGLSAGAYARAARAAAVWGAPLLVLGGGGYDSAAAARAWAGVVAALQGRSLPDDIPEHEHLDRFGPSFAFSGTAPLMAPDANDRGRVLAACDALVAALRAGMARVGGSETAAAALAKRARAEAAATRTEVEA